MKVGDLYRFRKPLMHYLSEYEGRFFIIREVKQNGDGDFDVYEITMVEDVTTWSFTGHELAYIAEKVQCK